MRALTALLALTIAVGPAVASEPAPKAEEAVNYVSLSPVALPVISGGKIVNYVFAKIQVDLARGANSMEVRKREPYFRDALIRAAHRTPFTVPTDLTKIDETKLRASLLRDARAIAGERVVTGVRVLEQTPKSTRVATAR